MGASEVLTCFKKKKKKKGDAFLLTCTGLDLVDGKGWGVGCVCVCGGGGGGVLKRQGQNSSICAMHGHGLVPLSFLSCFLFKIVNAPTFYTILCETLL